MKAPEYKGPASLSHDNYTENCKLITLPEGYRFLKIGEKSRKEDFHTPFGCGQWKNNEEAYSYGDVIKEHMWPHIRKVDYVRGPKGRFASAKPAPPAPKATLNEEMTSWINAKTDVSSLNFRIKEINAAIAGTSASGVLSFHWTSTPQQNGEGNGYWCARWSDKSKISDSDREYMKLVVEAMEARVKALLPKPVPKPKKEKPLVTIYAEGTGPSRKYRVEHGGAQLEEGDKELLKGIDTFRSAHKEIADLKAWKAKVLAATI